jgi:hypothetical protein
MGQMTLDEDGFLHEPEQSNEPEDLGYKPFGIEQHKTYQKILDNWDFGNGFYHSFTTKVNPYRGEKAYYKIVDGAFFVIYAGVSGKRKDKYRAETIPTGATSEGKVRQLLSDLKVLNGDNVKDLYLRTSFAEARNLRLSHHENLYYCKKNERLNEVLIDTDRISSDDMSGKRNKNIRQMYNRFVKRHPNYELTFLESRHLESIKPLLRLWHNKRFNVHFGSISSTLDLSTMSAVLQVDPEIGLFVVEIDGNPIGIAGVNHLKEEKGLEIFGRVCGQPIFKYNPDYVGISDFMMVKTIDIARELGYNIINCTDTPSGKGLLKFKRKYGDGILKILKITYNIKNLGDLIWKMKK